MAYKDKAKQREANAERQRRYKAKHKGVTIEGVTDKALPSRLEQEEHYHQVHCNAPSHVEQFANGVSCSCRKRGKDIKVFADLPPDDQATIDRMSTYDGKIDKEKRANRIAAAIRYRHLFPDR